MIDVETFQDFVYLVILQVFLILKFLCFFFFYYYFFLILFLTGGNWLDLKCLMLIGHLKIYNLFSFSFFLFSFLFFIFLLLFYGT
jgi:hypothetical protein